MRRLIFAVCLLLILPSPFQGATPDISIDIRQRVGFGPMPVRVRVTVEKHEDNRELCVIGKDGDLTPYSRCFNHEGISAPRVQIVEFKEVRTGVYEFYATVRRPLETKRSVGVEVQVLSRGGEQ